MLPIGPGYMLWSWSRPSSSRRNTRSG
jgi:hypothetical protein